MTGDLAHTIEDAHLGVGCGKHQLAAHRLGRDRVVVAVESHVDGLGRAHRRHAIGRELVCRQRQKARALFGEGLGNRAIPIVRPWSLVRHIVAPRQRLAVALLQTGVPSKRSLFAGVEAW